MAVTTHPADIAETVDRLRIDFLFLDLTTCARCRGTDRNLESALDVVRDVLSATGIEVEVNKVHVESAEQARDLRFVSSPTIRVDGSDIALELRESLCACEACTDGCGEGISCRVWVYRGREYTEPPVAMVVDAILRHVYAGVVERGPAAEPYELPDNLARFFAREALAQARPACCGPENKSECCGVSTGEGCGCR